MSLSGRPENEIPVARMLVDCAAEAAREVFAAGVQDAAGVREKHSPQPHRLGHYPLYIKREGKPASARKGNLPRWRKSPRSLCWIILT